MPGRLTDVARLICTVTAVFVVWTDAASSQIETLDAVLARTGEYVTRFERDLAGIVAEEHYEQVIHTSSVSSWPNLVTHRVLKSDLLLVRPQDADEWIQFRDVFEVDGQPVRDRSDRLVKLFLEPSGSTSQQVRRIVFEGARYNIGNLVRTINVPIVPLSVLDPVNQPRFRFERDESSKNRVTIDNLVVTADLPASANFRVSTNVWVIRYREVRRNTLIHTTAGRDLPSRGRFWIEPSTGRVLMSELIAGDATVEGQIDVSYQSQPLLGLLVPVEMREKYHVTREHTTVEGTATYTNFRQFQVKVDEKLGPVKEKPQPH
jgi:hypothetical protein